MFSDHNWLLRGDIWLKLIHKSTIDKDSVINHFIQFIKREASTVVVAGSKDEPIFPIRNPDVFVGAHGGIFHAERFLIQR